MSRTWRWLLVLGYPLLAANALIAFLYAVLWCRAHRWAWRAGVLTFIARRTMIGNPGGQGWSWIVGFSSEAERDRSDLRVHEFGHVVQEMVFAVAGVPLALVPLSADRPVLGAVVGLTAGGAAFALVYGATFFWYAAPELTRWVWAKVTGRGSQVFDWRPAYMKIPFEKQAYAKQDAYRYASVDQRARTWGHR